MLKQLRKKFVCITMIIVTLALSVIFGMVLHFTRAELQREGEQLLQTALDANGPAGQPFLILGDERGMALWPGEDMPRAIGDGAEPDSDVRPGEDMPGAIGTGTEPERTLEVPFFVIWTTHDGGVAAVSGNYSIASVGNQDYAQELAAAVLQQDAESGILRESGLRFLKRTTPAGTAISFADATGDAATMDHLMQTCLCIGILSWLALFLLALLCARWAVRPVEQAWQRQTQFVSDASHELNTPLTVIMANAELLATPQLGFGADAGVGADAGAGVDARTGADVGVDAGAGADADAERAQTYASNILSASHQMRDLVKNLLELARADNGSVQKENDVLDFSALVSDAVLPFEPVFYEKSLQLSTDIDGNLKVMGSAQRLRELVGILLDNAQKYSSPGGKTIVSVHRASRSKLRLTVADEGDPIPADQLESLFQRFFRSDSARAAGGGYGLGLSIARTIVEEHKGRIWAESAGGTNRFIVELPSV